MVGLLILKISLSEIKGKIYRITGHVSDITLIDNYQNHGRSADIENITQ